MSDDAPIPFDPLELTRCADALARIHGMNSVTDGRAFAAAAHHWETEFPERLRREAVAFLGRAGIIEAVPVRATKRLKGGTDA